MTKEELHDELVAINQERENKLNILYKKYALENAKFKIGDIVEDHIGEIKLFRG